MEHQHGNNGEQEDTCPACTGISLHEFDTPKPVDTHLLTASLNSLSLLRQELAKDHSSTCEGFFELDPTYDGDPFAGKKVACAICFPED